MRLKLGKKKKKGYYALEFWPHIELLVPTSLLLSNSLAQSLCAFHPPGFAEQAWLEDQPSRGLGIIEVVFFLITYKNIDKANHQPYDLLQVTGPLNSLNKARINAFPTVLQFKRLSSLKTILLQEGGESRGKNTDLNHMNKVRTEI